MFYLIYSLILIVIILLVTITFHNRPNVGSKKKCSAMNARCLDSSGKTIKMYF